MVKPYITAPQLFAGIKNPSGDHRCFFCNGVCDETHKRKDYVKNTFTNRDVVRCPASNYVCGGCVTTLNERATVNLIDGEIRKDQKTRLYSWLFDAKSRVAFTKAHLATIRSIVLNPPDPPFGIVFAVSGQKQLLFRSVVAWDQSEYYVTFEEERILVNVELLKLKLADAEKLIAAIGKPALEKMNMNHAVKFFEYYGNLELFYKWQAEAMTPLNRLAAFLSPSQKECQIVHEKRKPNTGFNTGRIPTQISLFD
jgi:CRISPR type IV-associated protein Csf1